MVRVWTRKNRGTSLPGMAYHIARNNQQLGVFEEPDLQAKLAQGELLPTDLAWTEGMSSWKPLGECVLSLATPPVLESNPYALVDICFIFREDRRCLHDLLAGTRVVQGQPSLL